MIKIKNTVNKKQNILKIKLIEIIMWIPIKKMFILILIFSAALHLANYVIFYLYNDKAEAMKAADILDHNLGSDNAYQSKDQNRIGSTHAVSWPKINRYNTTIHKSFKRTKNDPIRNKRMSELETLPNTTINMTVPEKDTFAYYSTPLFIAKMSDSVKQMTTTKPKMIIKDNAYVPLCDKIPKGLGPIVANKTDLKLVEVEKKFPEVKWGGSYSPPNCTARHRVAIIVPYRDRLQHLAIFLNHMHPFLMKQQIEYGIFIIEQEGYKDLNRAKLMNVGFMEARRLKTKKKWQCFIFHDIDLLPLDTRNLYSCPRQPRHMSASIDKLGYKLPYEEIFGGVSAMTLKQFMRVNGFSNQYWGWGGEDDDMFYRIKKKNYQISRYKMSIARYAMLDHNRSVKNPKRWKLMLETEKIFHKDGLSTLHYEVVHVFQYHLYTHILVNIDERSSEGLTRNFDCNLIRKISFLI